MRELRRFVRLMSVTDVPKVRQTPIDELEKTDFYDSGVKIR